MTLTRNSPRYAMEVHDESPLNGSPMYQHIIGEQARFLIPHSKAAQRILFHTRKACNPNTATDAPSVRAKARKRKRFRLRLRALRDRRPASTCGPAPL